MNIFNLFAKLTLDTSNFNKNIKDAEKKSKGFAEKTNKYIKVIAGNAWVELGKTILNVIKGLTKVTLDLVNYADRYSDLSAKYDISTKSLQEFEYIAGQNGATLDSLLSTMTMMYNRAKENDEVFAKLGVSVKDTNGNMKSMDSLFWEVKTALDNVNNSGDKSALMLEAFGRNAMSVGEVLRKDTTELQGLAQKANDLGIILNENTIQSASNFNDMLDEMRLRGKSAFAEFLAGSEGSEEKLDAFFDDVTAKIEEYTPRLMVFGANLLFKITQAMIKAFPKRIPMLIDAIFDVNWFSLGWDLGKALWKGIWQYIKNSVLAIVGKGWLWGKDDNNQANTTETISDVDVMPTGSYEVNERSSKTMEIKLTASGTSAMDETNIKLIAKELVPIIDKELGGI